MILRLCAELPESASNGGGGHHHFNHVLVTAPSDQGKHSFTYIVHSK